MHTLIYLSAASKFFSDEELIDILKKSRLNNSGQDITGLLLYHEGSILQVLEGEKETIQNLYNKIKNDPRHKGVIKLLDHEIKERSFADWSMGFKQISEEDWSTLRGYLNLEDKEKFLALTKSGNDNLSSIIKSFANVNMRNDSPFGNK